MPFDGYKAGADALGAVRDAINMYMELRSEKFNRQLREQQESRAARQLSLQEDRAREEDEQNQLMENERQRKQIEFLVTNFGGQRAPASTYEMGKKVGMEGAFEPEVTLPGRSMAMSTMAPPDMSAQSQGGATPGVMGGPRVGPQAMPSQPTGEMLFRMPESEKSRIAAYNAQAKAYEGEANRTNQMNIARMREEGRRTQIRSSMNNTNVMAAAMRYGIDVRDATQRAALEQRILTDTFNMDDRTFDNLMQGGLPVLMMRYAQPGGGGVQFPSAPQPPAPNYFPGSSTGGGRYSIERNQ